MAIDKKKYIWYLLNKESRLSLWVKRMNKYIQEQRDWVLVTYVYPAGFGSVYGRLAKNGRINFDSNLSYEDALNKAIEEYKKIKEENPKITTFNITNKQLTYSYAWDVQLEMDNFLNKSNSGWEDKLATMAVLLSLEFLEDMWIEWKEARNIMSVITWYYQLRYILIWIFYSRIFSEDIKEENILKVMNDMKSQTYFSNPYVYDFYINISEERKKILKDYAW